MLKVEDHCSAVEAYSVASGILGLGYWTYLQITTLTNLKVTTLADLSVRKWVN